MVDNQLLQADRDSIQNDLGRLMTDYDNLQVTNDSISANLNVERDRADSLMTRLKKERSWNLAKIKQYEKKGGYAAYGHEELHPPDRLAQYAQQKNSSTRT